jgi:hypothetical protein
MSKMSDLDVLVKVSRQDAAKLRVRDSLVDVPMQCDELFPVSCEAALHLPLPTTGDDCQSEVSNPTGPSRSASDLAVKIEQSRSMPVQLHRIERLSTK